MGFVEIPKNIAPCTYECPLIKNNIDKILETLDLIIQNTSKDDSQITINSENNGKDKIVTTIITYEEPENYNTISIKDDKYDNDLLGIHNRTTLIKIDYGKTKESFTIRNGKCGIIRSVVTNRNNYITPDALKFLNLFYKNTPKNN